MRIKKNITSPIPNRIKKHFRPEKIRVIETEVYTNEDYKAIREGMEQIKNGEFITHEELKRLEKL